MKRREFLKGSISSGLLLSAGGFSLSSFKTLGSKHLTVLHTNDVHSYIDPFPADHPKIQIWVELQEEQR
jgi:5'-nucleotidase